MIKLVYSTKPVGKKFTVFFDNPRAAVGITSKSFADVDQAIEFAWRLSDLWLGNVDSVFKDRMEEINHPMLVRKFWNFA